MFGERVTLNVSSNDLESSNVRNNDKKKEFKAEKKHKVQKSKGSSSSKKKSKTYYEILQDVKLKERLSYVLGDFKDHKRRYDYTGPKPFVRSSMKVRIKLKEEMLVEYKKVMEMAFNEYEFERALEVLMICSSVENVTYKMLALFADEGIYCRLAAQMFKVANSYNYDGFLNYTNSPLFYSFMGKQGITYEECNIIARRTAIICYHDLHKKTEEMFSLPSVKVDMGSDTKSYFDDLFNEARGSATEAKNVTERTVNQVKEFFTQIYEAVGETTEKLSDKISDLMESLTNVSFSFDLGRTIDSIANASVFRSVQNMFVRMKNFLKTPTGKFLFDFVFYFCLCTICREYFKLGWPATYGIMLAVSIVMPMAGRQFSKYVELLKDWYYMDKEEDKETLTEEVDFKSLFVRNVLSAILGIIIGSQPKGDLVGGFLSSTSYFSKVKPGIENTMEFMFSLISEFLNYLGHTFNIDYFKGLGIKFPRLEEIAIKVADVVTMMKTTNHRLDAKLNDELMGLDRELRNMIFHDMKHDPKNAVYRAEALSLLGEISKITALTSKGSGAKGGPRIEPVIVGYIGMPGVAKSVISENSIYDVVPRVLGPTRLENFAKRKSDEVFTLQPDNDYWEGYNGQLAIRIDDILQLKDAAGMPNKNVLNMISMGNTAPFFPNMAAVDLKGQYDFQGRLIFFTDNNLKITEQIVKSINCVEAFGRRVDICILTVPKEEYAIRDSKGELPADKRHWRFDKKKMISLLGDDTDERLMSAHDLFTYDWNKGRILDGPFTYVQVRTMIVDLYNIKEKVGTKMISKMELRSERAIQERRDQFAAESKNRDREDLELEPVDDVPALVEDELFFDAEEEDNGRFFRKLEEQTKFMELENPLEIFGLKDDKSLFTADVQKHIIKKYRQLAIKTHPDKGGNIESMMKLNFAFKVVTSPTNYATWQVINAQAPCSDDEAASWLLSQMVSDEKLKKPIPDEELITTFEQFKDFLEYMDKYPTYKKHVMPDEELICHIAERTGTPKENVRGFFANRRTDKGTPLGDVLFAYQEYLRDKADTVINGVLKTVDYIKESIYAIFTNKRLLLGAGAVIAAALAIWKLCKTTFEEQTERTSRKKVVVSQKYKPRILRPVKKDDETIATTQGMMDMANALKKNYVYFTEKENSTALGWILFLKKKMSVNTAHMFAKLSENGVKYIWLHSPTGDFKQRIDIEQMMKDGMTVSVSVDGKDVVNDDCSYTHWPELKKEFRDITAHFSSGTGREHSVSHNTHYGVLMSPGGDVHGSQVDKVEWVFPPGFANPISETYGTADWVAGDAISYNVKTKPGFCGLPWIVNDARSLRSYVAGIHVAGGGGRGLSMCVYKEDIQRASEEFYGKLGDEMESCESTPLSLGTIDEFSSDSETDKLVEETIIEGKAEFARREWEKTPASLYTIGTARWSYSDYINQIPMGWNVWKVVPYERVNSKSKLRKTPLFNAWSESNKVPALLHKITVESEEDGHIVLNTIDPWFNARYPYTEPKIDYNLQLIKDLAREYFVYIAGQSMPNYPWEPRLLTLKEACEGLPGLMKGCPRNTSAGYPWSKMSKKKFAFFGKDGPYEYDSLEYKLLEEKVMSDIELLKTGNRPDWVYAQFLKDELRSREKVAQGRSRLVMGSPVDKTLVESIYCKDFFRWLQENRIFNGSSIGINPFSEEWKIQLNWLKSNGDGVIAGDFKNWDGNQPPEFDEGYKVVMESYYYNATQEDRDVRSTIVDTVTRSDHLITVEDQSFIATIDGITPSGDLCTGPKNTVNNNLRSLYVRAHMLLKEKGLTHMDYDGKNLDIKELFLDKYVALGDDHVLAPHPIHKGLMTEKSYGEAMAECNFKYTDAYKGTDLIDGTRPLSETMYLKRLMEKRIPEYPEHNFAPLEISVILEMAYWLEQGCPPGTLGDVLDITSSELSAHGFDTFKEWIVKISRCAAERIGYRSSLLCCSDDIEEIRACWHRAIGAYLSREVENL